MMNKFLSSEIEHLQWEEDVVLPLLHKHFTDEQLVAIEMDYISKMPQNIMMTVTPFFLQSFSLKGLSSIL